MATEVRVTQIIAEAEVEAEAALLVSQLGIYAEVSQDELRVSQMGLYVELEFVEPEPEAVAVATYHPVTHGSRAMHQLIPDEITGYPFDPVRSWWTVVVPEESENLVQDPSFESGSLDYYFDTAFESVAVQQNTPVGATGGRYVLRLKPDPNGANGSFEWLGTPISAGPYTFSVDVYCTRPGWTFTINLRIDLSTFRSKSFTVTRTGWQRVEVTGINLASGTGSVQFHSPATNTGQGFFYLDRLQFEAKKYSTTPFDGDSIGWYDTTPIESYYWRGAPYQSSSVRRANTGTGGRLVHLSEMEFATTTILGLGMGPIQQRRQTIGRGKERYLGAHEIPRDFTITGVISGENWPDLNRKRDALIELFRIDKTRGREPIILRYQPTTQEGVPYGLPLEIMCAYQEGLGGNITNLYQETLPLQFHSSNPFPQETIESARTLTLRNTLVPNRLFLRETDGDYVNTGVGATAIDTIFDVAWDTLGNPLLIGAFTDLAGDSVINIAGWNGSNWVQYGEGPLNDAVRAVHTGREFGGEIFIGGEFTEYLSDLSGLPVQLNRVARLLVGGGWQILANGMNADVHALARDENGNVYIGGAFTSDADDLDPFLVGIALWDQDGDTFSPLGQGVQHSGMTVAHVDSIIVPGDGYVYLAGDFDTAIQTNGDPVFCFNVVKWNIAEAQWELMGVETVAGMDGSVTKILLGKDNMIYAIGDFSVSQGVNQIDDIDLRGFARYNGYTWEEVFDFRSICTSMQSVHMTIDEDGVFWFSTHADAGFQTPEFGTVWMFGWRNGVFYPPPYHMDNGDDDLSRHGNGPNSAMFFVTEDEGDGVWVPAVNTITYGGNADVNPTIVFSDCSPSFIYANDQKGGIYFRATLDIGENEQMRIPGDVFRQKVYSNFRMNMMRHISVGATDLEKIRLTKGTNRITVFIRDDDTGPNDAGYLLWRNRYWSIDPGVQ